MQLVAEVKAYGWSPEELAYQHPHLSLAQVHSALAYYWDHREEVEADLRRRDELAEEIRREVRSQLRDGIGRILFLAEGHLMVLLHGFIKKTQKTPAKELEIARKRAAEFRRGGGR